MATSLMDYIFRWLDLRFLSGTQMTLFSGLVPQASQLPASPSMAPETEPFQDAYAQNHLAQLAEEVAKRLHQVSAPTGSFAGSGMSQTGGGGIAPDAQAASPYAASLAQEPQLHDRGIYHAADAMRSMYEMGDAPSCPVCGAIMVRNGSCHRCMSCGTTNGCS
jgi:ribonucleoside-diphosphate reductase alpha chain